MRYKKILKAIKEDIEYREKDTKNLIEDLKTRKVGKNCYYKTQKAKERDIAVQEMFAYAMLLVKEDIEFYEKEIR